MLEVRELCFDYQDKPLLNKITFAVKEGQLLHLRGNNGAGKTTLLRLLAGLLHPLEGEIYFDGQPIGKNLSNYQHQLCYLGHRTGINPLLTVKENCFFDMHWGRKKINFNRVVERFGLAEFQNDICGHLSAGQRRRVGLLRLTMTDAPLWLLDEPLVALDKDATELIITSINNHLSSGGLIVLTSHQRLPEQLNYLEYYL
ncbi:cytochrome c biogenesis heme-transporting ATPase CcmA [Legionella clemsonensis]|uniref:Cytochrome c biogenesis ATP-binding export protein CcmA n=1 Tax=Legionella clemsonensis TaxID=1867846 RepID=A0A222P3B8_9GAMM|nr:cytochrome c biogenesis heme-transporting ATPase CcmA [Legionella clemsonensis]ASQ46322.1 Cytochrome c biogenesis ATP-binding export protein CcmA [Legionella clemsonensis]